MGRYIFRFLFVAIVVTLCLAFCEYLARGVENPYKYKNDYVVSNGEKIENVVLGSSHTYFGISPKYMLESSFNLANVSQPLLYDYYLLEDFVGYMPNLKRVVLDVGYCTLASSSLKFNRAYRVNYQVYMHLSQIPFFSPENLLITESAIFQNRLEAAIKGKSNLSCDEFGWGKDYEISRKIENWESAEAAIKRHTKSREEYEIYSAENRRNLSRIVKLCDARGVELVIVTTPIWHTYRELQDESQLADMYDAIEQLGERYEIEYYDFSGDARFEAKDFFDADHLSNIGAKKFSRILADTLAL